MPQMQYFRHQTWRNRITWNNHCSWPSLRYRGIIGIGIAVLVCPQIVAKRMNIRFQWMKALPEICDLPMIPRPHSLCYRIMVHGTAVKREHITFFLHFKITIPSYDAQSIWLNGAIEATELEIPEKHIMSDTVVNRLAQVSFGCLMILTEYRFINCQGQ